MAKSIARIGGIALKPGVSKNGRLYEKAAIAAAVERAQQRIDSGGAPLTMLSHHSAGDDSTRIVGRVTRLSVDEDGNARYEAEIADTEHGRTIAALLDPGNGEPFLKGVSIRGAWLGGVKRKLVEGSMVEYGDLDLDGLDFTKTPGVAGAGVDTVTAVASGARESADGRALIYESVAEANMIVEAVGGDEVEEKGAPALKSGKPAAAPTPGASNYADPGYQDDRAKRFPLDTVAHAKSAWSYVNQAKTAKNYTGPQLKRIKDRVMKALKKFGVKVTEERWLLTAGPLTESVTEMDIWPDQPGSYGVCINNGMVEISVRSCMVDPADLELAARAAMDGALAALAAIDPDMDGDIDTPGDGPDDESADETAVPEAVETEPAETPETTPTSVPAASEATGQPTIEKESDVSEPTITPAAETTAAAPTTENAPEAPVAAAPAQGFTFDQVKELFALMQGGAAQAPAAPVPAAAPAEAAPVVPAPVAETAPVVPAQPAAETQEQRDARIAEAAVRAYVQSQAETGQVGARKGHVTGARAVQGIQETADGEQLPDGIDPGKPMHEYSPAEWKRIRNHLGFAAAGVPIH